MVQTTALDALAWRALGFCGAFYFGCVARIASCNSHDSFNLDAGLLHCPRHTAWQATALLHLKQAKMILKLKQLTRCINGIVDVVSLRSLSSHVVHRGGSGADGKGYVSLVPGCPASWTFALV